MTFTTDDDYRKLGNERDEWKRRHENAVDMLHTAEEDCTKLRSEVETLKADKARLDWLLRNSSRWNREGIDAAMKGD